MRSHKTLESVAAEKFELLKALRPGGAAVLNADSSWVAAMAPRCERKVVWFGGSAESNLWADEISSCWPERLRFRLHAGSSSWRVKTQLVGTHWTTSLLSCCSGKPELYCDCTFDRARPEMSECQSTFTNVHDFSHDSLGGARERNGQVNFVTEISAVLAFHPGKRYVEVAS